MKYYSVRSKIIYTPTPTRFFNICCGKIGKKIWRLHGQNTLPYPCTPPHPFTVSPWVGGNEGAAKYILLTVWFSAEWRGVCVGYSCKTFVLHNTNACCLKIQVHFTILRFLCHIFLNSLNINHLHVAQLTPTYQNLNYDTKTAHKIRNKIPKSVNRH